MLPPTHLLPTIFLLTLLLPTVLSGCTPYMAAGSAPGMIPPAVPGVYHRVERGQTLWRIAKTYGVDLEALVSANRLADARRIEVGQQLLIPGATKARVIPGAGLVPGPQVAISGDWVVPGEDFTWPARGRVVSLFGARTDHGPNKGIDIQAPEGTEVRAARSGRVSFVDENLRGFGKTVIIDHGEALSTVYTHLAVQAVQAGQAVRQGEVIGSVGSTGRAMNPFLHFEVRRRHRAENPFYYLP